MPRLWILLMLAYGLLLRLDINRQLVRKAFKADNASVYMNCTFDLVRECLRCDNRTSQVPKPSNSTFMSAGEDTPNLAYINFFVL